ncbi:MAG: GxxExxY protein [Ignavibacterium sp.]|nr:GxxExxY protein [Ignavibacterium sp.]
MNELILKDESYKIIGICMDVHKNLGKGFLEVIYKDALEYEFNLNNIPYEREKEFIIEYKNHILPHRYFADFVVFNKIILEVKASTSIIDEYIKQTLNYLAVSKCKLGLIVNFGEDSLKYKRVVL